jgi:DNA-binding NarL/FixJ family response regulator
MMDEYIRPPATLADLEPRQIAVASLIARARTNQQIAYELGISDRRVRYHVEALAYLLHLDRSCDVRVQIATWWVQQTPDIRRGEEPIRFRNCRVRSNRPILKRAYNS